MKRGDEKCLRNLPNLSFVPILVVHWFRLSLLVTLPLPSEPLIVWNLTSGQKWRTEVAVTASLSSVNSHHLILHYQEIETSMPSWKN